MGQGARLPPPRPCPMLRMPCLSRLRDRNPAVIPPGRRLVPALRARYEGGLPPPRSCSLSC
eukprot:4017816-Alexandrium_andersonii.AAC.1